MATIPANAISRTFHHGVENIVSGFQVLAARTAQSTQGAARFVGEHGLQGTAGHVLREHPAKITAAVVGGTAFVGHQTTKALMNAGRNMARDKDNGRGGRGGD